MPGGPKELLNGAAVARMLARTGEAHFRALGGSMFPAIRSGDVIVVRSCHVEDITPGDVIVLRDGERLLAHRLVEKRQVSVGWQLMTRGDALRRSDPPQPASNLLGWVAAIARNGHWSVAPFDCGTQERVRGRAVGEWTRLLSFLSTAVSAAHTALKNPRGLGRRSGSAA